MTKVKKTQERGAGFKRSVGDIVFDTINVIFMIALCIITIYPMYYVLVASFTDNSHLVANQGFLFWPFGFTTGAYELAFRIRCCSAAIGTSCLCWLFRCLSISC